MIEDIMDYPAVSGYPEAYEKIVQIWLDMLGYITTTTRFFWSKLENKKQRGYRDLDVLAINEEELLIVSVTTELATKVATKEWGNTKFFFDLAEKYLKETEHYKWMTKKKIRKIIFYFYTYRTEEKRKEVLLKCKDAGLETKSFKDALLDMKEYFDIHETGKTESPVFTLLGMFLDDKKRKGLGIEEMIKIDMGE